jgi:hypothetical protein
MVGIVPRASSCQAFDPFGAVAASGTPAAGAFAGRKPDRSGPIAAAVWWLAPGSGDFSL